MQNKIMTWLADIDQAISEIKLFAPSPRNFFEFKKDLKGQRAIERNIRNNRGSSKPDFKCPSKN